MKIEEVLLKRSGSVCELCGAQTVVLIKGLDVKWRLHCQVGTAVRGLSAVEDNPDQIEIRVNGQQIVMLTQFVKKSG